MSVLMPERLRPLPPEHAAGDLLVLDDVLHQGVPMTTREITRLVFNGLALQWQVSAMVERLARLRAAGFLVLDDVHGTWRGSGVLPCTPSGGCS